MYLKLFFLTSILSSFFLILPAQEVDIQTLYDEAMSAYDENDYQKAADKFSPIIKELGYDFSSFALYNGACIYALNEDVDKAMDILNHLAKEEYYSNYQHVKEDTDLNNLHDHPQWTTLLEKIKGNEETEPERNRNKIREELFKAKEILEKDSSTLWGVPIWSEKILVLDYDNTIYSLDKLPESQSYDSILYFKKIEPNTLSFTNTTQNYNGEEYATVLIDYVDDNSSTIIHELFHLVHLKDQQLKADPVNYLEGYRARILLRLEFQALVNALQRIDDGKSINEILIYVTDAFLFRKERQSRNHRHLQNELELENVEGLANYTGLKLSSVENKYQEAISEIREREAAPTYTRPFPYATGPAYGLIFDFLGVRWRKEGIHKLYNFLEIYETKRLFKPVPVNQKAIEAARERNNYTAIYEEEMAKKQKQEELNNFYTALLVDAPVLKVPVPDTLFAMSFNMYGTLVLKGKGLVYSSISGEDKSGQNFGNFKTLPGKDQLGMGGIMIDDDSNYIIFPKPIKIEGTIITGDCYEIQLNEGWQVSQASPNGSFLITQTP